MVFRGYVSEADGRGSAEAFLAAVGADGPVDLTFDVREVRGYAGGARSAWQELLSPRRRSLRSMAVVSSSRLTRMGAAVFAMVMGIPCTVHTSLDPGLA